MLCCLPAIAILHAQAFDVASARPSQASGEGTGRPAIRVSPDRVTFAHASIQDCI
jgi:hypothetical protein